jgi:hypothetical protein
VSEFFATNAPDQPHWTPNSCFGVFQTVSLLHELWCKMGRIGDINLEVRAMKSRRNFMQQTLTIHPIGSQTHVMGVFQNVLLLHKLRCITGASGAISAQVRATKSRRNFSQQMHLIHPIGPQTHILWCFGPFHYCKNFGAK